MLGGGKDVCKRDINRVLALRELNVESFVLDVYKTCWLIYVVHQ